MEGWLLYRGMRAYYGEKVGKHLRYALRVYAIKNKGARCWLCQRPILLKSEWSVDHVIPIAALVDTGLANLLFDYRNLRPAHKVCNSLRSHDMSMVPESVQEMLKKRGWDNQHPARKIDRSEYLKLAVKM